MLERSREAGHALIVAYAFLLLGVALCIIRVGHLNPDQVGSWLAELLGFVFLTLPVILYFSFSECGQWNATWGKRRLGLVVLDIHGRRPGIGQTLLRNSIKFLPWKIAHFFVYRLVQYSTETRSTAGWVMGGLIMSMLLALLYFVLIFAGKRHRSVYEILSGTQVVRSKAASVIVSKS